MNSKEERWRAEGIEFCTRFLKAHDNDVSALEAEIKRRGIHKIPIGITRKAEEEFVGRVKMQILDTVLIMSMVVLHDEFGFGKDRLNRFKARFNSISECISDDFASWEDYQKMLLDECKIKTSIRFNN